MKYAAVLGAALGFSISIVSVSLVIDAHSEVGLRNTLRHDGYRYASTHSFAENGECEWSVKMGYAGNIYEDSWSDGCRDAINDSRPK